MSKRPVASSKIPVQTILSLRTLHPDFPRAATQTLNPNSSASKQPSKQALTLRIRAEEVQVFESERVQGFGVKLIHISPPSARHPSRNADTPNKPRAKDHQKSHPKHPTTLQPLKSPEQRMRWSFKSYGSADRVRKRQQQRITMD